MTSINMDGKYANGIISSEENGHFLRSSVKTLNMLTAYLGRTEREITADEMDTEDLFTPARDDMMLVHQSTSEDHGKMNVPAHTAKDRNTVQRRRNGSRLVSNQKLNVLWLAKKKQPLMRACEDICTFIKKKSKHIFRVYPAYDSKQDNEVQFVVLTEKTMLLPEIVQYKLVIKNIADFPRVKRAALRSGKPTKKKYSLTKEQAKAIRKVIREHAPRLLSSHQNLSVITGGVRLQTNGDKLVPKPVIVMYVLVIDKIPMFDDKLPRKLSGFPVVVEEGCFQTSVSAADRFQTELRLGCQITSEVNKNMSGTLGGFIEHPEYGLSGVTCAHVVLSKKTLHDQRRKGRKKWVDGNHYIYQPAEIRLKNRVGVLRETIYKSGEDGKSGVDLALFQIEDRPPVSGGFPEGAEDMQYDSGIIIGKTPLNVYKAKVVKYGRTTRKTEGHVEFCGAAVKTMDFNEKYSVDGSGFTYTLFDQIEVRPPFGQNLFSDAGDSGALVFTENVSKELVCVGMVVGNIVDDTGRRGNSIVTPASAIKDELGISEFKNFVWSKVNNMENRFNEIDRRLEIIDDMDTRIRKMETILEGIANRG